MQSDNEGVQYKLFEDEIRDIWLFFSVEFPVLPEELIFFLETDVLDGELGEGVVNLLLFVLLVPLEHPDEEELTADLANQENKQNQKN